MPESTDTRTRVYIFKICVVACQPAMLGGEATGGRLAFLKLRIVFIGYELVSAEKCRTNLPRIVFEIQGSEKRKQHPHP